MKNTLGQHLLVEFYSCDEAVLDDVALVEQSMNEAATLCGATIVQSTFHRFQPHGVSGVVVISESHLAIHTWPEYGYASVDLFTCGTEVEPLIAYEVLKEKLEAGGAEIQMIKRGDLDLIKKRQVMAKAQKYSLRKGGVA